MVWLLPMVARADDTRLGVVVREGAHDQTIVSRLRGQLADLEGVALDVVAVTDEVEPTLGAQLATADKLATEHDARVVVWFLAHGKKLSVAIATPRDHRLFVREIPSAAESASAEAAAIVVRSAVKSISLGGTIGIEVPAAPVAPVVQPRPEPPPAEEPPHLPPPPSKLALDVALGWQVALDGGAHRGAHALVQRTTLENGAWGASLAITLGVPLEWQAGSDVVLDVSRSGALVGGERQLGGGLAVGVGAGAMFYRRSTTSTPSGLTATPSSSTTAFAAALEVIWRAQLSHHIAVLACAGIDAVAGAPEAALSRDGMVEVVDTIRPLQPRASLAVEVGSW